MFIETAFSRVDNVTNMIKKKKESVTNKRPAFSHVVTKYLTLAIDEN